MVLGKQLVALPWGHHFSHLSTPHLPFILCLGLKLQDLSPSHGCRPYSGLAEASTLMSHSDISRTHNLTANFLFFWLLHLSVPSSTMIPEPYIQEFYYRHIIWDWDAHGLPEF